MSQLQIPSRVPGCCVCLVADALEVVVFRAVLTRDVLRDPVCPDCAQAYVATIRAKGGDVLGIADVA